MHPLRPNKSPLPKNMHSMNTQTSVSVGPVHPAHTVPRPCGARPQSDMDKHNPAVVSNAPPPQTTHTYKHV